MGKHGPGTRGKAREPGHTGDMGGPNMPAASLNTQGDSPGSGKRGTHNSDYSGNTTRKPKTLRGSVGASGDFAFDGSQPRTAIFNKTPIRD